VHLDYMKKKEYECWKNGIMVCLGLFLTHHSNIPSFHYSFVDRSKVSNDDSKQYDSSHHRIEKTLIAGLPSPDRFEQRRKGCGSPDLRAASR